MHLAGKLKGQKTMSNAERNAIIRLAQDASSGAHALSILRSGVSKGECESVEFQMAHSALTVWWKRLQRQLYGAVENVPVDADVMKSITNNATPDEIIQAAIKVCEARFGGGDWEVLKEAINDLTSALEKSGRKGNW